MNLKLRPYQVDIINQTLNTEVSTLIQIPTGGGKTIIAKNIIEKLVLHSKRVLFVAPKIILMDQTLKVFKELDPQLVHSNNKYNINKNLFVSTIQTASKRINLKPDVIFIDEIHFGYTGKMIDELKANNQNVRIIGLSATPYNKDGLFLDNFDLILDKYDIKYLIKHNYLTNLISYSLVQQDLSNVKVTAGDYNLKDLSKVACNDYLISEIVNTTKEYILESKKTIVFAVNIEHTKLLELAYESKGFSVFVIHSKLSKNEIKKRLEGFREISLETKILVSVLMLTTGFDMPEVDCAVLARPTKSQNLYKQMVGRILRMFEGKKQAILLDCGNVIENLGMPLEPIKYKKFKEWDQLNKCKECGDKHFKLIKNNNILEWKCDNCGFSLAALESIAFICKKCKLNHNDTSLFSMQNNELILNCTCGEKNLISREKGDKKLLLIDESNKYLSFDEARKFVRSKKLSNIRRWNFYRKKKPSFIPNNPDQIYKNHGWINWYDWIGKNINSYENYPSFEVAREIARKLEFSKISHWQNFIENHAKNDLPLHPNLFYKKDGWISWNDWFGKEQQIRKKSININISYEKARRFARDLNLTCPMMWKDYYSICYPKYKYPLEPKIIYKDNWLGWDDWLGL